MSPAQAATLADRPAYIDSDDADAAMDIARTVLLSHLCEHGPEYRRVGIHHADATPVC